MAYTQPDSFEKDEHVHEIAAGENIQRSDPRSSEQLQAQLAALHRASQLLQQLTTPENLSRLIIKVLEDHLGYDYGAVLLLQPQTGLLVPFALSQQGRDEQFEIQDKAYIAAAHPRLGVGITGWVAQTGQSALVGDVLADPRYYGIRQDIRSELCVPMFREGKVIGVVNVETTRPHAYSPMDQQVLETVSAQIEIAIQNASLYDELKNYSSQLEQRVHDRTAELEKINQELESFAYSVSHDLRAPLRSIQGYILVLQEDHLNQLDPKGQDYLMRIRESALQMGSMIDSLLEFTKMGVQSLQVMEITSEYLEHILKEIIQDTQASAPERVIEWKLAKLPACKADPQLLRQVWANLITNAYKYTNLRIPARIEIGHRKAAGEPAYFIRDNGIGFEMSQAGNLFAVFERLPNVRQYDGNGVGLAIARRIVERHQGRIWAEAELGKGATFYFTLGILQSL